MEKRIFILPITTVNNFTNAPIIITEYWKKFLSLGLNIETIYALYFNYESNYKGDYDFTIGCEQHFTDAIPFDIHSNHYKTFKCDMSTIVDTWQEIWRLEEVGELKRSYSLDIEAHKSDGTIDIYIGISHDN